MSAEKLIVYGHDFCPMVPVIRAILDESSVEYDYIDILRNQAGRQDVRRINHGYESVPTLLFADGSHLTEPSMIDLRAKLHELGVEMTSPNRFKMLVTLLFGSRRS